MTTEAQLRLIIRQLKANCVKLAEALFEDERSAVRLAALDFKESTTDLCAVVGE